MSLTRDPTELRAFGRLADEWKQPWIDRWGVIIPPPTRIDQLPSTGAIFDEGRSAGSEEAGPAAGSWTGRRASADAGAATHPVQSWLIEPLGLEDVAWYHPDRSWCAMDSGPAALIVPVTLFESLPYRAQLLLEVPATGEQWKKTFQHGYKYVPPVRAWATWDDGRPIRSHHENPDGSICACMPRDWGLGQPLEVFIGFCISWVAKALHAQLLGKWPGPQHYPPWLRILWDRPDEYCGCDEQTGLVYRDCCMAKDAAVPFSEHLVNWFNTRKVYAHFLRARGLPTRPAALTKTFSKWAGHSPERRWDAIR